MSVIAAVAEEEKLLPSVRSGVVQEALRPIAGRYKVIRQEIGGTTMALRDIVTGYLSEGLAGMGVTFDFPTQAPRNKPDFVRMMDAFQKKYPDKGLLFVLDELFDYLKSRDQQALTRDLAFLREVGEICASTSLVLSPEMSFCATGTVAAVLGLNVISSSLAYTPESDDPWNTPTRICACAR